MLAGAVALALAASGCGGGDDAPPSGTPAAAETATPGPTLTAAKMLPDLAALGFHVVSQGRDPAAQPGQDAHRGLFQKDSAPKMSARVDVQVLADEQQAQSVWGVKAEAMRNPPPDFIGASATLATTTPAAAADQARAYVTARADSQGNLVWTEVYRFGRSVVIVQLLGADSAEATRARRTVAEAVAALAR